MPHGPGAGRAVHRLPTAHLPESRLFRGCLRPAEQNGDEGFLITNADIRVWWGHYLSGGADPHDPHVSPLHAPDLSGLPPALVITAEYDPLRDPGEAYARRLAEAGVPTELRRYDGQIHAFFVVPAAIERARECMDEVAEALRKALAG